MLSIVVAREVGVEEFGAFGLAFGLYSLFLGISRSASSQPLVISYSARASGEKRLAVERSLATALTVSLVFGIPTFVTGLALAGEVGQCLVVLGVGLPGLLLQDALRYAYFTDQRPKSAAGNDALWMLLQAILIAVVLIRGSTDASVFLGIWAFAALGAASYGCARARLRPRITHTMSWLREHSNVSPYLAVDYAVALGSVNVLNVLLSITGNLATVAALRGAQVLLAPLRTFFYAATSAGLAEMANRAALPGKSARRDAALVSTFLAAVAALATLLALLIPDSLGRALLGDTWSSAQPVVGWTGLMLLNIGLLIGADMGLQIWRRSRITMMASLLQAPFVVGLGLAGQWAAGTTGAAAGVAVAHAVSVAYAWGALLRLPVPRKPPDRDS